MKGALECQDKDIWDQVCSANLQTQWKQARTRAQGTSGKRPVFPFIWQLIHSCNCETIQYKLLQRTGRKRLHCSHLLKVLFSQKRQSFLQHWDMNKSDHFYHQLLTFKEDFLLCPITDADGEAQECKLRYWSGGHSSDIQPSLDNIVKGTKNLVVQGCFPKKSSPRNRKLPLIF